MDDSDLTVEEYIRLEEEKGRRCGKKFNWETATYGNVGYFDDNDYLIDVETEFSAVILSDPLDVSRSRLFFEHTRSSSSTVWLHLQPLRRHLKLKIYLVATSSIPSCA
ncbi:hypothetical protein Tco_0666637 [Tanacetum coccineum]